MECHKRQSEVFSKFVCFLLDFSHWFLFVVIYFLKEFISLLSEARSDLEKIVVLKAMGNMGAKDLITPIKAIIEERSLSKYIRFEAVIALKKLAKPFDKVVKHKLMIVLIHFKVSLTFLLKFPHGLCVIDIFNSSFILCGSLVIIGRHYGESVKSSIC